MSIEQAKRARPFSTMGCNVPEPDQPRYYINTYRISSIKRLRTLIECDLYLNATFSRRNTVVRKRAVVVNNPSYFDSKKG